MNIVALISFPGLSFNAAGGGNAWIVCSLIVAGCVTFITAALLLAHAMRLNPTERTASKNN
ncbi:MAG: hypothetical protein ACYCPQ_03295 [Elusimicrobiota bacterium]